MKKRIIRNFNGLEVMIRKINKIDSLWFLLISTLVPLLVITYGDYLYAGLWYYLVIPLVAWLIAIIFCSRTGFLSGLAIALALEYILFLQVNWRADHQEGLVGLVHLFSLPGVLLGVIYSSRLLEKKPRKSWLAVLFISCASVLAGFTLMQIFFYLFSYLYVGFWSLVFWLLE